LSGEVVATQRMQVANEAFLLDRLAADAPRAQLYRELTQNAIEAIKRRMAQGDHRPGIVQWDVDWLGVPQDRYKLCVIDNGDGMSAVDMQRYLNSLAVQGANQHQSLTGNFGVGAKITALFHNTQGLVYLSWSGGQGNNVWLHRDDQAGVYGLKLLDDAQGGPTYVRPMADGAKPALIGQSGTKVILLGNTADEQTWRKPEGLGGGDTNWLFKYLNTRYFRLPENITLRARSLRRDPDTWPLEEPPASDQSLNFETIRGMKCILDTQVAAAPQQRSCGVVRLAEVNVHWWLFEDRQVVDTSINPRAMSPGHVGIVFQDELYTVRTGNVARKLLALFGVLYGADSVVLYLEPRDTAGLVHADTGRSRVLFNGADADGSDLWARWGEEFRHVLPAELQNFMDRLLSADTDSTKADRRQRILERLQRLQALLSPTRYRRAGTGSLMASGAATAAPEPAAPTTRTPAATMPPSGKRDTRAERDYLAHLVDEAGVAADVAHPRGSLPQTVWISALRGQRHKGDLEDRAADIPGDVLRGDVIRLNEDFRGFTDLFDLFVREVGGESDEQLAGRVREVAKEWIETQILEIVVAARGLEGNSFWSPADLDAALSPEALTASMMGRYFIIERVRRVLGNDVGRSRVRPAQPTA
jgi:hypothetical protein